MPSLAVTDEPGSYSTIAVARRLGVSLQTVQRWVDAGRLKAWKTLGGHRRVDAASAQALFDERAALSRPADTRPVSVVVVDDDPVAREVLLELVHETLPDARVAAAADGFQGLLVIGQADPDIVITDIQMPHMDGIEMLRALVDAPASRPRLLIAVSVLSAADLAARGPVPAGVQLFTKPLRAEDFCAALGKGALRRTRTLP